MSEPVLREIRAGDVTACPRCQGVEEQYQGDRLCPTCLNARLVVWRLHPVAVQKEKVDAHAGGIGR